MELGPASYLTHKHGCWRGFLLVFTCCLEVCYRRDGRLEFMWQMFTRFSEQHPVSIFRVYCRTWITCGEACINIQSTRVRYPLKILLGADPLRSFRSAHFGSLYVDPRCMATFTVAPNLLNLVHHTQITICNLHFNIVISLCLSLLARIVTFFRLLGFFVCLWSNSDATWNCLLHPFSCMYCELWIRGVLPPLPPFLFA